MTIQQWSTQQGRRAYRFALTAAGVGALGLGTLGALGGPLAAPAGAAPGHVTRSSTLTVQQVLLGNSLQHSFMPAGGTAAQAQTQTLSNPDDITQLGDDVFVGFQNGVGPQGQPNGEGNTASTIVEMTPGGTPVAQWDVTGKVDGLTADPTTGTVLATANEDLNSSLYVVDPQSTGPAQAYAYREPLPHNGGTDAISILGTQILISASAPGTTGLPAPQPTYPAVYSVVLDPSTSVATVTPFFFDEASAKVANVDSSHYGQPTQLALTDPASNEIVPRPARSSPGEFMLTSQGDQEQIFVRARHGALAGLWVLSLTQSVDDTAWPSAHTKLFATDSTNDAVDVITGKFGDGHPVAVATPCGANDAPATCPSPPNFPANYLASLNPWTGAVTALPVTGATFTPQGGLLAYHQSSSH